MPVEGFKVDTEKAVGHVFPSEKVVCNRRDFLLYALGVGVKEDELKYLYELSMFIYTHIFLDFFLLTRFFILDKDFSPLPTYPLVLLLKGDDYNVNLFKDRAQGKGSLPGMPYYDPNKIVHGEQSLEVFKTFPVDGGVFSAKKSCTGVYDKGKFF
jgi:peroxisomal enoyl-CoA hydratase 2